MIIETQWSEHMGCNKSNYKKEVYSNKSYLKKQEKSQVDNLTLHLKQLEKNKQNLKLV